MNATINIKSLGAGGYGQTSKLIDKAAGVEEGSPPNFT
jgi:hypothetical protein